MNELKDAAAKVQNMDSPDDKVAQTTDGQPVETKSNPLEKLAALPPDQELSGTEIGEFVAALINVVRKQQPALWSTFMQEAQREFAKFEAMPPTESNFVAGDDPQSILEQTYQDLQTSLIRLRQAIAQAIAAEKQLEQQLQKNQGLAKTWDERADMALKQKNLDLQEQALARSKQYKVAVELLSEQVEVQRRSTRGLREQLTEMEAGVQKAYTRKQVLISRQRSAQATIDAKHALSAMNFQPAIEQLAKAEEAVEELELQAASVVAAGNIETDLNALLIQMALALDSAVKVINALQAKTTLVSKTQESEE